MWEQAPGLAWLQLLHRVRLRRAVALAMVVLRQRLLAELWLV